MIQVLSYLELYVTWAINIEMNGHPWMFFPLAHKSSLGQSGPVNARRATIEMQSVGVGWGSMTA